MKTLGSFVGMVGFILSWTVNHSFWWGVFHFIVAGIYIPYWLIVYSPLCKVIAEWIGT
jgi:hypothetical protein